MTNKYTLLIDMDGVLADWTKRVLAIYRQRYPDRPVPDQAEITRFYIEELFPEEHRNDVMAISREAGFYASLEPMSGAIEVLKDIEENCQEFIDPFLCSSPEVESEGMACHSEKAQWVEAHLGSWWTKRLILTKDKTLVRGHFLIDDKPTVTGAMTPTWLHLVFDRPYNQDVKNAVRFSWSDWPSFKESIDPNSNPIGYVETRRIILPA